MEISKKEITKLTIIDIKGLDPVNVIMEDFGPGQGKITVDCYGEAWTAYWGAMGNEGIAEFINTADVGYLAGKLSTVDESVIDYGKISQDIDSEVDRDTLAFYDDDLVSVYGSDWRMCLPTKINSEYGYLCRIVGAVKEAVASILGQGDN